MSELGGPPLGLGREGVPSPTCLASVSLSPTERLSLGLPPLHPPSCLRALVLPWVVADRGGSPGLIDPRKERNRSLSLSRKMQVKSQRET